MPAVLGALIIRKPGAAFFTLTFAALVSVAARQQWGWTLVVQGPLQGVGGRTRLRGLRVPLYRLPVALLGRRRSPGSAASIFDVFVWYPDTAWGSFRLPYVADHRRQLPDRGRPGRLSL